MREENKPLLEYKLVMVRHASDGWLSMRLRVATREGVDHTLRSWTWPPGSLPQDYLDDILATTLTELEADLVMRMGVQRVFDG